MDAEIFSFGSCSWLIRGGWSACLAPTINSTGIDRSIGLFVKGTVNQRSFDQLMRLFTKYFYKQVML